MYMTHDPEDGYSDLLTSQTLGDKDKTTNSTACTSQIFRQLAAGDPLRYHQQ